MSINRSFRLAMVVFVALWFGAVLPGHERGVLTVPGASSDAGCHTCPSQKYCSTPSPASDGDIPPTDDPASHCALCKFIGTLDAPALIDMSPPLAVNVDVLDWPAPSAMHAIDIQLRLTGRAPPKYV